ncbi:MAG TPA: hypothetical protein VG735_04105, partial [Caulobacterales bacterium]|nr:hypothetical protein [Caulobacterales bacterium]
IEIKLIKQGALRARLLSHHQRLHRLPSSRWNHASPDDAAEFFNKIGENRPIGLTLANVRLDHQFAL